MKIIKNYIFNAGFQFFNLFVVLIITPYLSRVLEPDNYGVYSYVASVSSLVGTVGLIGLDNYSIREVAYCRNDQKALSSLFFELLCLRIVLMMSSIGIFLLFGNFTEYNIYFRAQIFALAYMFLDLSWFFFGLEEFKYTTKRLFVVRIIFVMCIFLFVKKQDDLIVYILLNGLLQMLGLFMLYPQLKKYISLKYCSFKFFKHFKPTIKVFLPQLAGMVYLQVDKIMIEMLTGEAAYVGFYDQAEKIVKIPLTVLTAFSTVMLPRVSSRYVAGQMQKVREYIKISMLFILMFALPMCVGLICTADYIIPWFLGEGYEMVAPLIVTLSSIIIFIGLTSVSSNLYFVAQNRTKILTISYILSAIVNLIINTMLIPVIGAYGAAVGTVAAEGVAFIIQYYYIEKEIKIFTELKDVIIFGVAAILMAISIIAVKPLLEVNVFSLFLIIALAVALYFIFLALFRKNPKKMFSVFFEKNE